MVLRRDDEGYQQCSFSVMDNIEDPDINFDKNGVSNYYYEYKKIAENNVFSGKEGEAKLKQLIQQIKKNGNGKPYDCITGVSGGVDSSFLILKAKECGLRPLIVHFDNGWNSEIAVSNINKLIEFTGFNLYTIVVDWEEFKDLQLSYFKASVVDIEVPTDHAISGTLQRLAAKYKIKHILSGNNVVTEAILPTAWHYNKNDYINLASIHKIFGRLPLKTYPLFGLKEQYLYGRIRGIETVKPLNYIDYNKRKAKDELINKIGWKDYGGKHYESFFTKFYQAYILPEKFKIDKRKAHLSNLIFSGQITKDDAIAELEQPLYTFNEMETDKVYFLKKMGLTPEEFNSYMKKARVEHVIYGKQQPLTAKFNFLKWFRPLKKIIFKN